MYLFQSSHLIWLKQGKTVLFLSIYCSFSRPGYGLQWLVKHSTVPHDVPVVWFIRSYDCSHEIKRRLLLGRKVMINLDSILKSRDITLPTKVRLWFFLWSCMDVRVGLWRKLSTEELILLNCGVGEGSWESLGLKGDPTSPFWRRPALGFLWKEWC